MALEKSLTKFIWKIENFSCFEKECFLSSFLSPSFISRSGVSWRVRIYPQFTSKSDSQGEPSIKIELQQLNDEKATVNCSISLLDSEGTPLLWREHSCTVPKERFLGNRNYFFESVNIEFELVKKSDVYGSRKAKFLPNGVLTVECRIWEWGLSFENLEFFARTRIEPQLVLKKKFDLNLGTVSSLQEGTILEHEEPLLTNGDSLNIAIELSSAKGLKASLTSSLVYIQVKCLICVITSTGKRIPFTDIACSLNETTTKHCVDTNIKINMLENYKDQFLPNDVLSLGFECTVNCKVSFNRLIQENVFNNTEPVVLQSGNTPSDKAKVEPAITLPSNPEPPNNVSAVVKDIYKKAYLSDFCLRVQDKTFAVHKCILGSRSTVFDAMFAADMKEKEDNSVEITDFDASTIQRMLDHLYTDQVESGLDWEEYSSLYSAADKYNIVDLNRRCSSLLEEGLNPSNVLECLLLADAHQDLPMKDAVLDYIADNGKQVVGTETWNAFKKENAQLALDVFQYLYLKKM